MTETKDLSVVRMSASEMWTVLGYCRKPAKRNDEAFKPKCMVLEKNLKCLKFDGDCSSMSIIMLKIYANVHNIILQ